MFRKILISVPIIFIIFSFLEPPNNNDKSSHRATEIGEEYLIYAHGYMSDEENIDTDKKEVNLFKDKLEKEFEKKLTIYINNKKNVAIKKNESFVVGDIHFEQDITLSNNEYIVMDYEMELYTLSIEGEQKEQNVVRGSLALGKHRGKWKIAYDSLVEEVLNQER